VRVKNISMVFGNSGNVTQEKGLIPENHPPIGNTIL